MLLTDSFYIAMVNNAGANHLRQSAFDLINFLFPLDSSGLKLFHLEAQKIKSWLTRNCSDDKHLHFQP